MREKKPLFFFYPSLSFFLHSPGENTPICRIWRERERKQTKKAEIESSQGKRREEDQARSAEESFLALGHCQPPPQPPHQPLSLALSPVPPLQRREVVRPVHRRQVVESRHAVVEVARLHLERARVFDGDDAGRAAPFRAEAAELALAAEGRDGGAGPAFVILGGGFFFWKGDFFFRVRERGFGLACLFFSLSTKKKN